MITLINLGLCLIIAWTIIFIVTLVIEFETTQMVSIWFSAGSFVALILAICQVDWKIQLSVFLVIAAICIFLFKFILKRKTKPTGITKTNIDALIGQEIKIINPISKNQPGEGKFRDIVWTCVCDEPVNKGEICLISEISGNHLVVKKKEKKI